LSKIRQVVLLKLSEARSILAKGYRSCINEHGVTQGIMMFIVAAIMLAVLLPVLNGVLRATPVIVTNRLDVGNLSGGGGVLGPASINSSQVSLASTIGSSYGLLVIVLILISAAVIIGAVGLFKYFQE
jgi:hypothetical protein